MIGQSGFSLRAIMLIALVAIVAAPAAGDRAGDGSFVDHATRADRASSGEIVLAQRCFTYKGQLKCF